ncbi:MAG: transporter substrate-binding domain-containing protein [Erysipelotrichaceae bacterium]
MKKILLMLLAVLLLAGCGQTAPAENSITGELLKDATIIVGTSPDYPPFENLSTTGELEGFDIDVMNALVKIINEDNDLDLTIEWKQLDFNSIIGSLQTNQIDVGISAFSYSEERDVFFSTSYLASSQVVLVKVDSDIADLADLEGKKIGVQSGSTGEDAAQNIKDSSITSLDDANLLVAQLQTNTFDAIVLDGAVASEHIANSDLVQLSEVLVNEDLGVIANHGKDNLAAALNAAIEKFIATDEYQELLVKWELN